MAGHKATGRMPGKVRADPARCAAARWGGPVVAYVSRSDTISARTVLQIRKRLRICGGSRAERCASPVF